MLYDKVFAGLWTALLISTLTIFGLERFDISLEQTLRARTLVHFSSPPLESFGENAIYIQTSKKGKLSDFGFPEFQLELINPLPYTRIKVDDTVARSFMHKGVFSKSFSDFYGSDVGYAFLKYLDPAGSPKQIYVWFGYPDYDQSEFTIVYQIRPAVQDEIPANLGVSAVAPKTILKGEISDISLQVVGLLGQ